MINNNSFKFKIISRIFNNRDNIKLQSYSCQTRDDCGNLKNYEDLTAAMINLFWIKLQIHI